MAKESTTLYGPDGEPLHQEDKAPIWSQLRLRPRKWLVYAQFIGALVAVASVALSWHFARASERHSEAALRNQGGTSHIDMLLELNKILIERPELWSLYDGFLLPAETTHDPYLEPRKEALMYYYMNMFERVSNYYAHIAPPSEATQLYEAAWTRFLRGWLRDSTKARQIVRRGLSREVYPDHFAARLSQALMEAEEPVPVLITNARAFGRRDVDAVLLTNGTIFRIGTTEELRHIANDFDRHIKLDAEGGWLLPGIHDAHSHLMKGAIEQSRIDVTDCRTLDEIQDSLRRAVHLSPDGWLVGRGWRYDLASEGEFPTANALDIVSIERPIALTSYDGHALWVNTMAMQMAGIDGSTVDPPTGTIVRGDGSNEPSGIFLDGAIALIHSVIPLPTREEQLDLLRDALQQYVAYGVTSVDVIDEDPMIFTLLDELESHGDLPIRVRFCLPLEGDIELYQSLRRRYASPMLSFGFLKGYVDGVIESETALMLEPYEGGSNLGKPLNSPTRLARAVRRAHREGFQVALHCIGDGAVRLALDIFEDVQREQTSDLVAHRIEHVEVLNPADAARFADLGIIASMQPLHANPLGANPNQGVWAQKLGSKRLHFSFPWRTLLDADAQLAFGSDWPVASPDPLQGLAVAITRRDSQGRPREGWNAHQSIRASEAIASYTLTAATKIMKEGEARLAEGDVADLVLLEAGVDFDDPASLWSGDRIHAVIVNGRIRFPFDDG